MAITVTVKELLEKNIVESTRIEYKADFNPEMILHTICAFANDIDNIGGGYILVGVEEKDGNPVTPIKGLAPERLDGIQKKLREYCHFLEPLYEPIVEPMTYENSLILVIWVPGGYGRPYKAPKYLTNKQSSKYYYIRKFSSSTIASPEEEKELFYISSNIPFDDRPNLLADVDSLDINLLRAHLQRINSKLYVESQQMSLLELARSMQLVAGPPEHLHPLNVATLMFCAHPEQYFRYARIEVVDIPDPTGNNMTEKVFTGPIQYQLEEALKYIKNYILKEVVIKDPQKAEATRIYNYPYAAVEELLANAVYHRSYQVYEPITVRITPASMEITSFPGFDRSISDADIETYNMRARFYRNRRIGDFLKELHLIEGRNTGFPMVFKALQANGNAMPKFVMNLERDYLSVIVPVHEYFLPKPKSHKQEEYEGKIIALLELYPLSLTELAKAMGYKGISAKLKQAVEGLLQEGRLEKIVPYKQSVKLRVRR